MSETYADLGGGTSSAVAIAPTPTHRHRYDPSSGWCGCGARDTGELAEGSIAWRAARATA